MNKYARQGIERKKRITFLNDNFQWTKKNIVHKIQNFNDDNSYCKTEYWSSGSSILEALYSSRLEP